MDVYVQSFLNSATKLTLSVNTSTTFEQLKTLVFNAEGTTSTIMGFYVNGVEVDTSATMAFYSITTGSYIGSFNTIEDLPTREDRQIAKLNLAQLRRQSGGNTTTNYYREFNVYDRDLLPAKYIGNTSTDISNTLTAHRPWLPDV